LRHWLFSMAHFWRSCFAPPLKSAYSKKHGAKACAIAAALWRRRTATGAFCSMALFRPVTHGGHIFPLAGGGRNIVDGAFWGKYSGWAFGIIDFKPFAFFTGDWVDAIIGVEQLGVEPCVDDCAALSFGLIGVVFLDDWPDCPVGCFGGV
jgi:hypothetical protein